MSSKSKERPIDPRIQHLSGLYLEAVRAYPHKILVFNDEGTEIGRITDGDEGFRPSLRHDYMARPLTEYFELAAMDAVLWRCALVERARRGVISRRDSPLEAPNAE